MVLLACRVLTESLTSDTATATDLRSNLSVPCCIICKNEILCLQSIANSSQFIKHHNPIIFCGLRTLWQKHPGVVSLSFAKSLTPIESKRFANTMPNPFRMRTIHDTPGGWATVVSSVFNFAPAANRFLNSRSPWIIAGCS